MNKKLICFINMFDASAKIVMPDESTIFVESNVALDNAYAICQKENLDFIQFYGNEDYIDGLISQSSVLNYNEGKVKIKVN